MKNITYKMVQWSTPEELYEACVSWLSQLEFIKDEQRFLNDLITNYTIPLISANVYHTSLAIIGNLLKEEKELIVLIKKVQEHRNNIEKLLDPHIDPQEMQAYKETQYYLKLTVFQYTEDYRKTKTALFDEIKEIVKGEDPKSLSKI